MSLFKSKKQKQEQQPAEVCAKGWDAIVHAFEQRYPNQLDPKHYGTIIKWRFGGNDPLDGISIYDGGDYWHFVTFGLSELYEKESENTDYSGYGMEFTFKLKKDEYEDSEGELRCICGILQSIARITFEQGELFQPYEYVYTGQSQGIDSMMKSNITGFITLPDQEVASMDTEYGRVDFVQFMGVTKEEITAVKNKELNVEELYRKLQNDVTDYHRASCV